MIPCPEDAIKCIRDYLTDTFNFEILESLGIINTSAGGDWTKELNLVRFDRPDGSPGRPLFDIRQWSPDHSRFSKGLRLREDEVKALAELLKERY